MKVTYIDHMGTDLSVVNAARVSFAQESDWEPYDVVEQQGFRLETGKQLSRKDKSLIQFLARGCTSSDWDGLVNNLLLEVSDYEDVYSILNNVRRMPPHWSPFAHTAITLHLKMPIFVARQVMKHTAGMVYNEISRRYVDSEPELYMPPVWRARADNVKQGSSDKEVNVAYYDRDDGYNTWPDDAYIVSLEAYQKMLELGVAPEQARMVLPQSMYTEVIATGNLFSWANMYIQRTDPHAQKETRDLIKQVGTIIEPLFPVSWEALVK